MENQFVFILQSTYSQGNSIEQANQAYFNMLLENPEELALLHFKYIESDVDLMSKSSLVLFGRYFTLLSANEISLSDEASVQIQIHLLSLFQKQNFDQFQLSLVSYIIFQAANFFIDNWPSLPESLFNLIKHPNSYISSNAAQCLSSCIRENLVFIQPYYDLLLTYIRNFLAFPTQLIPNTIISILRLLYSLIDLNQLEQDEKIQLFMPFIDYIPNYMHLSQNDPVIINDFYVFYKTNRNLLSESYRKYYEALMRIINDPSFCYGSRSSAIYTLISIISRYSEGFQLEVINLFNIFTKLLYDKDTFEDAVQSLQSLSEIYGGNPQYAQYLYDFFQSNISDPFAFVSFGLSYEGIKDHFANTCIPQALLDNFIQGFASADNYTRYLFFYSFSPLVPIFHQSNSKFSSEIAINSILKSIAIEGDEEIFMLEIKILSQLLKFYISNFQQNITEIINLLDTMLSKCNHPKIIAYIIKCYKYLAISYKEQFIPFSETIAFYITQCINNPQQSGDLFFYCMKELPYFKYSFPQEIFNNLITISFQFLIKSFDENGNEIEDEGMENISLNNALPYIMKFFRCALENDTFIDSPELFYKIVKLSINIFSDDNYIDEIRDSDLDLSECCEIIPIPNENKSIVISNDIMALFRNTLSVLSLIFKKNPQVLQFSFASIYEIVTDLLQTLIRKPLFYNIFELEITLLPFIQNNEKFEELLKLNFNVHTIFNSNLSDLRKLTELISAFLACTGNENYDIITTLFCFTLQSIALLDVKNNDLQNTAKALNNITYDCNTYLPVKIRLALVLREMFRSHQPIMQLLFTQHAFNLINKMQDDFEPSKIIATIIYSDFILNYPQVNADYWSSFVELFKSNLQSQDLNIRLSAIYGLSTIINPNNTNTESIKQTLDSFTQYLQNDFNNESCSMIIFALLQLFQNYSSAFDVSIYFQQFWQLLNGETFHIPTYSIEYFTQSLIFFISNFANKIPTEKIADIKLVIQKLLVSDFANAFIEPLNSLLARLS